MELSPLDLVEGANRLTTSCKDLSICSCLRKTASYLRMYSCISNFCWLTVQASISDLRSVLLSDLYPPPQQQYVDYCNSAAVHYWRLPTHPTMRIGSQDINKYLVGHTALRRTTLILRGNTCIHLSLYLEFDIIS